MKLLLTSGGMRNKTLCDALLQLADKPAAELRVAFIPTAMHPLPGDKGWVVDQMIRLRELGIKQLDIVDVAVLKGPDLLSRLEDADVIFVNGGNTTYLMQCFNVSGLSKHIRELLADRVYVGVSAGSYIATPDLRFNSDDTDEVLDGLGFVDFGLQMHLNSPKFSFAKTEAAVTERVRSLNCPYTVYALDDQMAALVDGDRFEIVGEGSYLTFPPAASI